MTFEQFQETKAWSGDLGAALGDARWEHEPTPGTGNLYLGCLYIEKVAPHWPENVRALGDWCLTIGNAWEVSGDLAGLERKLYEFAVAEGYCQ